MTITLQPPPVHLRGSLMALAAAIRVYGGARNRASWAAVERLRIIGSGESVSAAVLHLVTHYCRMSALQPTTDEVALVLYWCHRRAHSFAATVVDLDRAVRAWRLSVSAGAWKVPPRRGRQVHVHPGQPFRSGSSVWAQAASRIRQGQPVYTHPLQQGRTASNAPQLVRPRSNRIEWRRLAVAVIGYAQHRHSHTHWEALDTARALLNTPQPIDILAIEAALRHYQYGQVKPTIAEEVLILYHLHQRRATPSVTELDTLLQQERAAGKQKQQSARQPAVDARWVSIAVALRQVARQPSSRATVALSSALRASRLRVPMPVLERTSIFIQECEGRQLPVLSSDIAALLAHLTQAKQMDTRNQLDLGRMTFDDILRTLDSLSSELSSHPTETSNWEEAMKIGSVFSPVFDPNKNEYHFTVGADTILTHGALPQHGGKAWRQTVNNAVAEQAQVKYPHIVALAVMEQLLESLIDTKVDPHSPKMKSKFLQYQKLKRLALDPGTKAEGRTAAKSALRVLTTVLEEAL